MAELSNDVIWRKSSRSGGAANCVEIALTPEIAAVRDSKTLDGPRLIFAASGWVALRRTVDFPRFRP